MKNGFQTSHAYIAGSVVRAFERGGELIIEEQHAGSGPVIHRPLQNGGPPHVLALAISYLRAVQYTHDLDKTGRSLFNKP
ncbi:MAG: hypothetical protein ACD_76C00095G0006 [uncultured bacterium]|nr:MAG: hypothetical protein ACD_76C00095G0006 [uncultured bacterium]HBD04868.1 hypothetical protein [Candidatus Uhrbacteria bacterium]